tara:strand:+ start:23 stop:307 length:285 start_codon:yes stop_codon:yes gene_type:complete
MMALLQLVAGLSTLALLALYALVGAVAVEDLAQCWSWTFGVALIYGSIAVSVFAYLAEMVTIRLLGGELFVRAGVRARYCCCMLMTNTALYSCA